MEHFSCLIVVFSAILLVNKNNRVKKQTTLRYKMDTVDNLKKMGGAQLAGAAVCTAICCSPFVVLTVYMGIFAFKNPDKQAWYGIDAAGDPALYAG